MNFFNQGIPLGRWFRITVIIHWTFLIYAANELLRERDFNMALSVMFMVLLFGTVLIHEFGHALSCRAVGGEALQIVLWPLGGLAFVQPPMNPRAWLITTVCGPLVNAVFWPAFYFISKLTITHSYGALGWEYVDAEVQRSHGLIIFSDLSMPVQACLYMWQINKILLLFNLIPAYPMDGGRLLQEILWFMVGYARSMKIAGMVGTIAGCALIVLGLGLHPITVPGVNFTVGEGQNIMLCVIGLLCAMQSFGIYQRANQVQGWRKN